MADKKKSMTQEMGVFREDEPAGGGGKRSFDAGERRGLAAFEKRRPADDPARGHQGAARSSDGGRHDAPAHRKLDFGRPDDVDDDLRKARLEASPEHDDDGMVATSRSLWDEVAAQPARGRRGRAAEPAAEEVAEEEEAPKRRSSAWKWIGGVALLGAIGAGTAIGISASQKPSAPETAAATKPAPPTKHADEADEAPEDDLAEASADAATHDAAQADAAADVHAAHAGTKAAGAEKAGAMNVSAPAPWAAAVEASNAWVDVAPAAADHVLGLSASEVSDGLSAMRTGFHPEARLLAPKRAYRIGSHEVTWGELAQATTLPEVATFPRPRWLPRDAARQAVLPATGVPWAVASAFCRGLGGDLPSEAEWEWAARGPDDLYWPWGRTAFDATDVHVVARGAVPVVPVKSSKLDRTLGEPGIFDLLGNALEWTRDPWRPANPSAPADPRATTHKAVRGWPLGKGGDLPAEGSTYRSPGCADPSCMAAEGAALEKVGFRCVRDGG